jgi:flagellin
MTSAVRKLTSGLAINSAADDPAGLCMSEKMRAQIRGLQVAKSNARGTASLLRTADGALSHISDILQRMRELAVQSATGTNDDKTDREALQAEFLQLREEIDDISETTAYNMRDLLDGALSALKPPEENSGMPDAVHNLSASMSQEQSGKISGLVIQIGSNTGEEKTINIDRIDVFSLGMRFSGIGTRESAADAISCIDSALEKVSSQRGSLGAMIKSFDETADMNISTLAAAESRIRDTDIAKEMTNFTNAAILQQISVALMAQANAVPKNVLYLLSQ